jgi:hypothetical protein
MKMKVYVHQLIHRLENIIEKIEFQLKNEVNMMLRRHDEQGNIHWIFFESIVIIGSLLL